MLFSLCNSAVHWYRLSHFAFKDLPNTDALLWNVSLIDTYCIMSVLYWNGKSSPVLIFQPFFSSSIGSSHVQWYSWEMWAERSEAHSQWCRYLLIAFISQSINKRIRQENRKKRLLNLNALTLWSLWKSVIVKQSEIGLSSKIIRRLMDQEHWWPEALWIGDLHPIDHCHFTVRQLGIMRVL